MSESGANFNNVIVNFSSESFECNYILLAKCME